MNRLLLCTSLVLGLVHARAQTVLQTAGDPLLLSGGAMDLPSLQGAGFKRFAVTLPTVSGMASNTVVDAAALKDLLLNGRLQQSTLDDFVAGTNGPLFLGSDAQFQAIGFGLNLLRDDSTAWLSVGLDHRERQLTALRVDQDLIDLLYYGNKRYAGSTVTMDPLSLRSLRYRALGGQVALDLPLSNTNWRLRPGVGVYHLRTMHCMQFSGDQVDFYTSPDGRYVDVTSDYRLDVGIPDDDGFWSQRTGDGMALDASIGMLWKDRLQLHLGVNDIGKVKVKVNEGTTNYDHKGTTRYEGVEVAIVDVYGTPEFRWDTLANVFDPVKTHDAFTMRLPTTFLAYAQWALGELPTRTSVPRHLVWGSFRQALSDDHFTRNATGGALGYTYSLDDRFNAGASLSLPGSGTVLFGLHATVRMGPVRLGISSQDLLWVAAPGTSLSADVRLALQLAF